MAKNRNGERPAAADTSGTVAKGASEGGPGELLDIDQAMALVKTTRPTFYRWLRSGKVKGMKVGRQWRFYRGDIERFLKGESPRIEVPGDIARLIRTLEERLRKLGATPAAGEADPARAVDLTIQLGVALGASDIHFDPFEDAVHIRYRVDGVLHEMADCDWRLHRAIISRWKIMAGCDTLEKNLPQDGRIRMGVPGSDEPIDLRVCFVPAQLAEALTVRILRPGEIQLTFDRLDYQPRDKERFLRWLEAPWGLVIVTGPTGCGKTTVLYTCLAHLVRPEIKIMSVEDPIEYLISGIVQVPVRGAGLTFASAIRAFLRSGPDVIMIGEIRDFETLSLAQQAALTGHLVLTTLHTDDAAWALRRMVDVGADPFLVADTTKLIVAQRLVRKLCPACSMEHPPESGRLSVAEQLARTGGAGWDAIPKRWRKHVGCGKCKFTGYRGRTVIAEVLEVTPEIGVALRRDASAGELRTIAVGQGMTTIGAHGVLRAAVGETTLEEILSLAPRA